MWSETIEIFDPYNNILGQRENKPKRWRFWSRIREVLRDEENDD